jgi:hypothetical protein
VPWKRLPPASPNRYHGQAMKPSTEQRWHRPMLADELRPHTAGDGSGRFCCGAAMVGWWTTAAHSSA